MEIRKIQFIFKLHRLGFFPVPGAVLGTRGPAVKKNKTTSLLSNMVTK